jgi:hypothetical protein
MRRAFNATGNLTGRSAEQHFRHAPMYIWPQVSDVLIATPQGARLLMSGFAVRKCISSEKAMIRQVG